jgi:phage terminase Nu1 subunit (DNA packaging protein)
MAKEKQAAAVENGAVYVLQAGTPVYIKTADVCALTGKSNQWIGQLTAQGTLNKASTKHGAMYNLRDTMKAYCAMLDDRTGDEQTNRIEEQRLEAELSLKKAKAIIAALEAKELQGKMHRAEDVSDMTEDLVYAIRGMLLALPGRLAVDACKAASPAEASELIRAEVYKVMDELSRYEYDPKKYEERVRERHKWSKEEGGDRDED